MRVSYLPRRCNVWSSDIRFRLTSISCQDPKAVWAVSSLIAPDFFSLTIFLSSHWSHSPQFPSPVLIPYLFIYLPLRAAPAAYGSSQAKGQIWATAACHSHRHSSAGSEPCLWPTPQLTFFNARSLTHWVRPGIESVSSWMLVEFMTTEPQ